MAGMSATTARRMPPGHWNVIPNQVSDSPSFVKRLGGTGRVLNDLELDVNTALQDAACGARSLKRYYDGWRPIEAIRYMGQRGQSSVTNDPRRTATGHFGDAELLRARLEHAPHRNDVD
jgi:hypothetical protein